MSHNRDKLRSAARVKAHEDFAAGVINFQQWKDTRQLTWYHDRYRGLLSVAGVLDNTLLKELGETHSYFRKVLCTEVQENTLYNLVYRGNSIPVYEFSPRGLAIIRIRVYFSGGLKETAELVDNKAPLLKTPVSKKEADKIIADLAEQEIQLEAIEVSAENPFLTSQEYGC